MVCSPEDPAASHRLGLVEDAKHHDRLSLITLKKSQRYRCIINVGDLNPRGILF